MKTLKVGIATYEQMKGRTLAVARGEHKPGRAEPRVWFTSMESFARVHPHSRLSIHLCIFNHGPLAPVSSRTRPRRIPCLRISGPRWMPC